MLGSPSETLLLPQRLPNARCPDTKKYPNTLAFGSVHFLSCVRIFVTPCIAACQASLSITNSWSLLKLMSIESMMPSNHLILYHPLLLLPSIFACIRVFLMSQLVLSGGQRSFSFSISPSNEYLGLISFKMD